MLKEFSIVVDVLKTVRNPVFTVNTNDLNTLKLSIILNKGGTPVDLTNATSVRLAVKKPDRKTVFQDVVVTDAVNGKIEITLDSQAYIVSGNHEAELMIYFGSDVVSVTGYFTYMAKRGILDNNTVESTNEFQAITKVVKDAEGLLKDIKETGAGVDAEARSKIENLASQLAVKISTINGIVPDENGNVEVEVGSGGGPGINLRDVTSGEIFTIGGTPPLPNTAPILTTSFVPVSIDDKTTLSIPYTVTDDKAGTLTITETKNGAAATKTVNSGSNTWNVGLLAVGNHTLTLKATDAEGLTSNTLTFNITVAAQVVNTAPVISSSFTPSAIDDKTSVSIPYTVTDDKTENLTLSKTIDGTTTTETITKGSNTWSVGALSVGDHVLSLKVTDSEGLVSNTLSFSISVTAQVVNVAVTGISLNANDVTVNQGLTSQLTATVAPTNATNKAVTWSSSNPSVATVNSSGLVTGVAAGNAIITATTSDGGFVASSNITVAASNFAGKQNAYIENPYMYLNPESILDADIALRTEGEPTHVYFSMTQVINKVNLGLTAATSSNASNVFNGVIPYAGAQTLSEFTAGTIPCPDICYITNQNTIYLRIPKTLYESNGNKVQSALYSIANRLPILNNPANEEIVITDAIIDAIASLGTITVVNGMHSGFANMSAGLGANTSITNGVNSISGRYISTETLKETWFVNATTRLNFKIPQSKMPVCNVTTVKQYLKDNRLKFWIAK